MPNADGEPVYLNGRDFQHRLAPGGLAGLRLSLVGRPARQLEVLAPDTGPTSSALSERGHSWYCGDEAFWCPPIPR